MPAIFLTNRFLRNSKITSGTDLETNETAIINSQDDIWTFWKLYLNDGLLHKYSLERLRIIQCGSKLSCPEYYSMELYDLLNYKTAALVNPVSNNSEIFDHIFDLSSNKNLMSRQLHQISYEEKLKVHAATNTYSN